MIGVYSSTNYRSLPRGGSLEQLTYHDGICKSYGHLTVRLVGPVPSRSSEHETQQETGSRTILITRRFLIIKNAITIFLYRYKCEQTNKYTVELACTAFPNEKQRRQLLHYFLGFSYTMKVTLPPKAFSKSKLLLTQVFE